MAIKYIIGYWWSGLIMTLDEMPEMFTPPEWAETIYADTLCPGCRVNFYPTTMASMAYQARQAMLCRLPRLSYWSASPNQDMATF